MRYWSKNTCLTGSALSLTIWEYITMLTDWKAKPIEPESKHLNLLSDSNFNQHFNICFCSRFEFFFISTFLLFHPLFYPFHFRILFIHWLSPISVLSDFSLILFLEWTFQISFHLFNSCTVLSMNEFKRNFPYLKRFLKQRKY